MREYHDDTTMRWLRRGGGLALLLIGWAFILRANHFNIGPAVVFICLAYFAGVAALYTLFRLGATAVAPNNEDDDEMSWGRPLGELEELEREKRALLKAIKESEFDLAMGKLSKADADAMIAIYRGRAIEVIKEIDVQTSLTGKAGTVRDRILREARARIEVEEKASAAPIVAKKKKKGDKDDQQKARADKLADAVSAAKAPKPDEVVATGAVDADDPADAAEVAAAAADAAEAAAAAKADEIVAVDKPDIAAADASDAKPDTKSEAKEAAR
jgi:hypothetical protein